MYFQNLATTNPIASDLKVKNSFVQAATGWGYSHIPAPSGTQAGKQEPIPLTPTLISD